MAASFRCAAIRSKAAGSLPLSPILLPSVKMKPCLKPAFRTVPSSWPMHCPSSNWRVNRPIRPICQKAASLQPPVMTCCSQCMPRACSVPHSNKACRMMKTARPYNNWIVLCMVQKACCLPCWILPDWKAAPFSRNVRLIRCMTCSAIWNSSSNPSLHSVVSSSVCMMHSSGLIPIHNGFAALSRTLSAMRCVILPEVKWWSVYYVRAADRIISVLASGILARALPKNSASNCFRNLNVAATPRLGVNRVWA